MKVVSIPEHGDALTEGNGEATRLFQAFLDEIVQRLNDNLLGTQVQLATYTVTTLPSATAAGGLIYVFDEVGGSTPAFSDGIAWRRVSDRAIVS